MSDGRYFCVYIGIIFVSVNFSALPSGRKARPLSNLPNLIPEQPEGLEELNGLFYAADVAHFGEKKLNEYIAYADQKGRELGRAEGRAETAIKLKSKGMSFEFILDVTGLTEDELKNI